MMALFQVIYKDFMKRFERVPLDQFSLDVPGKKMGTLLGTLLSRKTISIQNQFLSLSYKGAYHCTRNCQYVPNGSHETIGKDPFCSLNQSD